MTALLLLLLAADDNLVDRFVDAKAKADRVPMAAPAGDAEFLRRVSLDLTGRLPTVKAAREFLASRDADKRQKMIDSLFPPLPVAGMRSLKEAPFLDRWTYFFDDLFRNGQLLEEGINTQHDYIYKVLTLNLPYDEFVRDLITATAVSTWTDGPANFIARSHIFEGDGYQMNHEDTADEIAINTTKLFLGVNAECISCHDGAHHLEKVNLWLSQRKRTEFWRQASFFGQTFISPVFGRSPQFLVKDTAKGYNLTTRSSLRPARNPKADVTPTFLLSGERIPPGEKPREAYARLLTSHPQFARATVNLFWAELMGQGIVDGPFDFDLARQDPKNPPPAPWTLQPSHPELLDVLAEDFRKNGHDLRRLMRQIVSSRAYARTIEAPKGWQPTHESYFSRRVTRRLSAEQTFDAIAQVTGVAPSFTVTFSNKKAASVMQTRSPQDIDKSDPALFRALQAFGQCDRYAIEADRKPSMVQAAILMNDKLIRERLAIQKGSRLEGLLRSESPASNEAVVDELYLAALSRPPSETEKRLGVELIREHREAGAEDLLWMLVNRLDFLFY
ncbi:MAG: DUF1549 and DUF1553 domain-containing protein [Bryobacteraceae bacterium]|nr:DUF1549 and DUF1553 domain-containing protein [Bryobacteraceae bacterium]